MPEDLTKPSKAFDHPEKIDPQPVLEVTELFSPGEMAPSEGLQAKFGDRNKRLPNHCQEILRNLSVRKSQSGIRSRGSMKFCGRPMFCASNMDCCITAFAPWGLQRAAGNQNKHKPCEHSCANHSGEVVVQRVIIGATHEVRRKTG